MQNQGEERWLAYAEGGRSARNLDRSGASGGASLQVAPPDTKRARRGRAGAGAGEARAEAGDLRQQFGNVLTAAQLARDEAAGLRAELDVRKQWGLWRRVRGR